MKCSLNHRPDVAIVDNSRAFSAIEGEWEDLYQNSPLATPFQSWAWLYSWWESYGEDHKLQLITLRERSGLLVGLIPLMLVRRWGFSRLLFVGTGVSDYLDILARRGWEEEASEAGMQALQDIGYWHVADLHQLRPEAVAWRIFRIVARTANPFVAV
jgi:CelD/BcsL family acetyltransferase involved in cellulose biosynthesis